MRNIIEFTLKNKAFTNVYLYCFGIKLLLLTVFSTFVN